MENVKLRLDAWRAAQRHRDAQVLGSPEWQEADDDARSAAKVFHAAVAQTSARYGEEDFEDQNPWWARLDRRRSETGSIAPEPDVPRLKG